MSSTPQPRGWAYIRVSDEKQAESTLGIRGYIADVIRYADAYGIDLGQPDTFKSEEGAIAKRERILIDAAVSAYKKRLADRPQGRILCSSVRPGDHILIPKLSRGFRNIKDCLATVERWESIGVKCVILNCPVQGKAMLGIFAAVAELESEEKSNRQRDAYRASRLAGRPAKRDPDAGFTWVRKGGRRYMVPCPKEIALAKKVSQWKADEGLGAREIRYRLNQLHIRTPDWGQGNLEYSLHRIYGLLKTSERLAEIERLTGIPAEQADEEWLRKYAEAVEARREERERRREKIRQRREWAKYQKELGAA